MPLANDEGMRPIGFADSIAIVSFRRNGTLNPTPPGRRGRIACFTSFNRAYIPRALVLARTLRQAHPDWDIWALVVDALPRSADSAHDLQDFDQVVTVAQLGIEHFQSWIFKHNVVEACTAVKGYMFVHLLEMAYAKVIYLDPDIAVFHPLKEIESKLDMYSIILTPHQIEPNDTKFAMDDNELMSLKYGIYNLGFLGVANNPIGLKFAAWWRNLLYDACYEEVEAGLYTDQKYCDLVPSLFSDVHIERDPGCNVASWNLSQREIEISKDGRIFVNRSPLKFYHFTKVGNAGDVMTARYAGNNFEALEIWNWYKRQIDGIHPIQATWSYGTFRNGVPIPYQARVLYRRQDDLKNRFRDPFDTEGESYYAWLRKEKPWIFVDNTSLLKGADSTPQEMSASIRTQCLSGNHLDRMTDDTAVDELWYLAAYPDVAEAVQNGVFANAAEHYAIFGLLECRLPRYIAVDETYYLTNNGDVRLAIERGDWTSAQAHFEAAGYREGRLPKRPELTKHPSGRGRTNIRVGRN